MAALRIWIIGVVLLSACDTGNYSNGKINAPFELYLFVTPDCPLCQEYFPFLDSMIAALPGDSFVTYAVFPAKFEPDPRAEDLERVLPHATVVIDKSTRICKSMNATVTPEVVLKKGEQVLYQGLIDNWPRGLGQKGVVTAHYLADALQAARMGQQPLVTHTNPIGCIIEY